MVFILGNFIYYFNMVVVRTVAHKHESYPIVYSRKQKYNKILSWKVAINEVRTRSADLQC